MSAGKVLEVFYHRAIVWGICVLLAVGIFSDGELNAAAKVPDRWERAGVYALQNGGVGILVSRGGEILYEDYARPEGGNGIYNVQSITKAVWVTLLLRLASEKRIDLDVPSSRYVTEWRNDPKKRGILIKQHLRMESGMASGASTLYRSGVPSLGAASMKVEMLCPAGERFIYGPANYEFAGEVMRRALGGISGEQVAECLRRELFRPMGIQHFDYQSDLQGRPYLSASLCLGMRDLEKLGRLWMQQGKWDGRRLVDARLMQEAVASSHANAAFGMGVWLNRNAKKRGAIEGDPEEWLSKRPSAQEWERFCFYRGAPAEMLVFVGSRGQRVYIVPEQKLVIVRIGTGNGFSDREFLKRIFGK